MPAVNDSEIEKISGARLCGGRARGGYVTLRLPLELRELSANGWRCNFPDKLKHALSLVQSMHGGKDYEFAMGSAHGGLRSLRLDDRPTLRDRRAQARLSREAPGLRTDLFKPPAAGAEAEGQLSLF